MTPTEKSIASLPDMSKSLVERMVQRFLQWKLPENFNPDCGISFDKWANTATPELVFRREPVGTNLFDYEQATAMVRYMLDGIEEESF